MRRLINVLLPALLLATSSMTQAAPAPTPDDPYLWLEDVQGDKALAWVRERNAITRQALEATPGFDATRAQLKAILDSRDRIPVFTRRGEWLYNLWQDEQHPRGLWRRATLTEYRKNHHQNEHRNPNGIDGRKNEVDMRLQHFWRVRPWPSRPRHWRCWWN